MAGAHKKHTSDETIDAAALTCPVCACNAWSPDLIAGRILGLPARYRVLSCSSCGQRRLDPQLSEGELRELYSGAYFNSALANTQSEIGRPSADYVSEVVPERFGKFERTVRSLKRLNPLAKTLLDVGAATGDFVRIARDEGFEADGIELSEAAIEMAKDRHAIQLERLALVALQKDGFYDCIHINHVFEHFGEPVKELRHIHRLLANEGLLYIEVPYQFNFVEKWMFRLRQKEGEFTLHSLHHPFFYTPRSIVRLLSENGFEVIEASVFDSARYEALSSRAKIKKLLWRILAKISVGNYVEIYARRKS